MMLSTKELCCFSAENPPGTVVLRETHIQENYDEFCKDKENGKRFIQRVKDNLENNDYYYVENDFPYYVESHIKHMVCWYKKGTVYSIINKLEKKNIITYWENLTHNKSVKDINHIHIFINK
mgnify:FL=1|jgi:hypothetical protein